MDFFQLWDQILDYIDQYDHPYYDMFSNEVFPISMTENTLTISPKNKRRKPWIENVYKGKLEKIIFDITGKQLSIEISDIMNQPAVSGSRCLQKAGGGERGTLPDGP
jgi:chromosomal replication initiation ATPase DnaA